MRKKLNGCKCSVVGCDRKAKHQAENIVRRSWWTGKRYVLERLKL